MTNDNIEPKKFIQEQTTHLQTVYCIAKDGKDGKPLFFGQDDCDWPGGSSYCAVWESSPFCNSVERRKTPEQAQELMDYKNDSGKFYYVNERDRAENARVVSITVLMNDLVHGDIGRVK